MTADNINPVLYDSVCEADNIKPVFQGLPACWARHKHCAELLYEGLEKLGLKLVVKDKVKI